MAGDAKNEGELYRWQRRLLPFLVASIIAMAVFFFVSSLFQLARFSDTVSYKPDARVAEAMASFERANPQEAKSEEHLHWKTLALLEETAIEHRYAQVNSTLLLRAWTRHLGFLTGMILALVGAIFILAKLSESETKLSVSSPGAKGALATSSPGIVLAVLGTTMMVVTLTANFEFETKDAPVYIGRPAAADDGALPAPPPLDDAAARQKEEQNLFPEEGQNESSNPAE